MNNEDAEPLLENVIFFKLRLRFLPHQMLGCSSVLHANQISSYKEPGGYLRRIESDGYEVAQMASSPLTGISAVDRVSKLVQQARAELNLRARVFSELASLTFYQTN